MARKKLGKSASSAPRKTSQKTSAKRPSLKAKTISLAQSLANQFHQIPKQFLVEVQKEIKQLSDAATKVKHRIQKTEANTQAAEKSENLLRNKANTNTSAKKRFKTAQAFRKEAAQLLQGLNKELAQIKMQIHSMTQKQTIFTGIDKLLTKMAKEVEARAKKAAKIDAAQEKAQAKKMKQSKSKYASPKKTPAKTGSRRSKKSSRGNTDSSAQYAKESETEA